MAEIGFLIQNHYPQTHTDIVLGVITIYFLAPTSNTFNYKILLYAKYFSSYIFWDDQISGTIERSRPDGSDQRTIVHQDVVLPNQLLVHRRWVKIENKSLPVFYTENLPSLLL